MAAGIKSPRGSRQQAAPAVSRSTVSRSRRRTAEWAQTDPLASAAEIEALQATAIEFMDDASFAAHPESQQILDWESPLDLPAERATADNQKIRLPKGLPAYVASLYEVPLLGKSREAACFLRMNYLKSRAAHWLRQLVVGKSRLSHLARVRDYLQRSLEVRNEIIRANLRLVVSIAKKYADQHILFDELVSEGNLPLMRAVDLFDASRGYRFSTYATWAIRNHLRRYLADRHKQRTRFHSGDEFLADCPADELSSQQESISRMKRLRHLLDRVMQHLTPREQQIMSARYGLTDAGEPQTLAEIGRTLGISKERVRQLALEAVEKLQRIAAARPDARWSLSDASA